MHSTESLFLTNAGPEFHQIIQFIKVGFTSSQSLEKKSFSLRDMMKKKEKKSNPKCQQKSKVTNLFQNLCFDQ